MVKTSDWGGVGSRQPSKMIFRSNDLLWPAARANRNRVTRVFMSKPVQLRLAQEHTDV